MDHSAMHAEIRRLAKEKGAVILAHNYQRPEVQDVADFVGDSLGLSRQAAAATANMTVFCGVHFMAETAAILAPDRPVILPDMEAGCPMADMVDVEGLEELKAEHPGAVVVSYVNTTAAVKAISDICCTSANAVERHPLGARRQGDHLHSRPQPRHLGRAEGRTLGDRLAGLLPHARPHRRRRRGEGAGPRTRTPRWSSTRSASPTWWLSPTPSRARRG